MVDTKGLVSFVFFFPFLRKGSVHLAIELPIIYASQVPQLILWAFMFHILLLYCRCLWPTPLKARIHLLLYSFLKYLWNVYCVPHATNKAKVPMGNKCNIPVQKKVAWNQCDGTSEHLYLYKTMAGIKNPNMNEIHILLWWIIVVDIYRYVKE